LKPQLLKRDRENCTVFVADLPNDVMDEDIHKLFNDVSVSPCAQVVLIYPCLKCGNVREVKITTLPDALVATVEFQERVYPSFLAVFGCLIIRSIGQCAGSLDQRQEADQ